MSSTQFSFDHSSRSATRPFAGENGATLHRHRVASTAALIVANIAMFMVLFQVYKVVRRTFAQRSEQIGYANAEHVIDFERRLHMLIELPLQRWTMHHEWLIRALNWNYAMFMWVFYACCAIAIAFAPERFRFWRRVFLCSMVIALPWYALYPLAPPRFMPAHGFVDTLQIFGPQYFKAKGGLVAANQYAAMPSMHVGWTTVGALMVATALPWRRLGIAIGAYLVIAITVTVMATGNHYFVDAVAGWLVVAAAYGLARSLPTSLPVPRPALVRSRARSVITDR